jgi:hypothetical protein
MLNRTPWLVALAVAVPLALSACSAGASNDVAPAAASGTSSSAAASQKAAPAAKPASRTVTYTVTGSGKATSISYLTVNGGDTGEEQANGKTLPWKKVVKIKDDGLFETSIFSLTAQNGGTGKITCKIEADGKTISKHSSSGQYAVVSCSGSASK